MIIFNCIYAPQALLVRKFLRTVNTDEVINYMEIINKLTKNDVYSCEPSDIVVNSYIIKYLEKSIIEKGSKSFYYVLSNLDETIICNLQEHVNKMCNSIDEEITYNITVKGDIKNCNLNEYFQTINELILNEKA